jgi:hypothetical protein
VRLVLLKVRKHSTAVRLVLLKVWRPSTAGGFVVEGLRTFNNGGFLNQVKSRSIFE